MNCLRSLEGLVLPYPLSLIARYLGSSTLEQPVWGAEQAGLAIGATTDMMIEPPDPGADFERRLANL